MNKSDEMNSSTNKGIATCFAILLVFSLGIAIAGSDKTDPMMYNPDGSSISTSDEAPTPETSPSPECNSSGNSSSGGDIIIQPDIDIVKET
jgi:hypothetical protein